MTDSGGPGGLVSYQRYRQLVRKYPRTQLLRAVSTAASRLENDRMNNAPIEPHRRNIHGFALAGIARTCLISSNEHRPTVEITDDHLSRLCLTYISVEERRRLVEDRSQDKPGWLVRFLLRTAYEQFPSQWSTIENLGRTYSLLHDFAQDVSDAPNPEAWRDLLGVELDEFMRVGFTMLVAALNNQGVITRDTLRLDSMVPIFEPLTVDEFQAVLDNHFVGSLPELQRLGASKEVRGSERWSMNPLQARPIVDTGAELMMPAPHFLIERFTTVKLYFTGLQAWGTRFSDALGRIFERYVEAQLALLEYAEVHGEVTYGPDGAKSCDFIVVMEVLVLAIEVKIARPIQSFRLGLQEGIDDTLAKLSAAREQVARTVSLIREPNPAFEGIPVDRSIFGLVITLEPFYVQQTMQMSELFEKVDPPTQIICSHELEKLVSGLMSRPDVGARLLQAMQEDENRRADVNQATEGIGDIPANPILATSWDRWAAFPAISRYYPHGAS